MKKLITHLAMACALFFIWGIGIGVAQPYCNQAQSTPGFASTPICQVAVCNIDPFCCDNLWDGFCALAAATFPECNSCGLFCNVSQGGPGFPADLGCQTAVCVFDPFCCETTWDGLCAEEAISFTECSACLGLYGCTDPSASNYVAGAVFDTEACEYIFCDQEQSGPGFSSNADCAAEVCADDPFCCNTLWDSSCAANAAGYLACQSCLTPIVGCTNPLAINYNPDATVNGDCIYPVDICCYSLGANLCPLADCANSVCLIDLFCCTNNWDSICASEALDVAACNCPPSGCTNPIATNYDPSAIIDDGSCEYDPFTCCEAIASGFSCPFSDCAADVCAIDSFCCDNTWDSICAGEAIITPSCNCAPGCTSPIATNYNPDAVYDDGSCEYDPFICCEAIASGFSCPFSDCAADVCAIDSFCCDNTWDSICAGEAIITPSCNCAPGCTSPIATNYNPDAVYDDGSCEYDPFICCEAIASGFSCPFSDCAADVCAIDSFCCDNTWDSICAGEAIITPSCNCAPGCTHPSATNYNPEAVYDDGSCEFAPNVCCEFIGLALCPISECAAIVCANDSFCCSDSWDSVCATAALEIDECNCGDPTSVAELDNTTGFSMFPNPNTGGFVNITLNGLESSNNDVVIQFFNISGKLVSESAFGQVGPEFNQIVQFNDALATGLYVVNVAVNGKQFAVEKLVVR